MRHRLYYVLPDIESARRAFDDLLLSRIEQRHIHFMGGGTGIPNDLPEANLLHKTDVVHGAEAGMLVGVAMGFVLGFVIVYYYELTSSEALVVLGTSVAGLLFGGWAASMVAAAIPNSRLKELMPRIEQGGVLLIVDVPMGRVKEIEELLAARHPEMRFGGEDPNIPVFP